MTTRAWEDKLPLKTYLLGPDDPNPPWHKRGHHLIYPYPMQDNLTDETAVIDYRALHLENDYLHAIVLPDLGARLYSLYDKVGKREVFYRNHVVKYGLVARRGAWISGGIEFNFPKGHTCLTVSPVEGQVEDEQDEPEVVVGAIDRTTRMRWQVRLSLSGARMVQRVALENPTPIRQRHYWWSNSAVPATDDLKLVFPAYKARMHGGEWPYPIRQQDAGAPRVDVSWYKNHGHADDIFALDVRDDFFGCYYMDQDHGLVHWSDHRLDFGKKFFTWGTADDGMRWVDLLTDDDGQYVEIQSGRFVDQSTFEFLFPFQSVGWTEHWWPVRGMGGWNWANEEAALNVQVGKGRVEVDVFPTTAQGKGTVKVLAGGKVVAQPCQLKRGKPTHVEVELAGLTARTPFELSVLCGDEETIWYEHPPQYEQRRKEFTKPVFHEPPKPPQTAQQLCVEAVKQEKQACFDEARALYVRALELDANFAPAHFGLGLEDYRAGLFEAAREHLRKAVEQDPEYDEPAYYLALSHLWLWDWEEADTLLARLAGRSACQREAQTIDDEMMVDWPPDMDLPCSDPMWWYRRAGLLGRSHYDRPAALRTERRKCMREMAKDADPAYCFPCGLDDLADLQDAVAYDASDWLARLLLGNLLAYLGRNDEAFATWQEAAGIIETRKRPGVIRAELIPPTVATLYRNIGLALSLWHEQHKEGLAWYDKAIAQNPDEYHLHLERDQLVQKAGLPAEERLRALEEVTPTIAARWEVAARKIDCLVTLKRWPEALELLTSFNFKPWEGARSMHSLWAAAQVGLAQGHIARKDWPAALASYERALEYPHNLGVGRLAHPHEAKLHWLAAEAAGQAGQQAVRQRHLKAGANERHMRVTEASVYKLKALRALGREHEAAKLEGELREWAREHKADSMAKSVRAQLRRAR